MLVLGGLVLVVGVHCHQTGYNPSASVMPLSAVATVGAAAPGDLPVDESLAAADPLLFLKRCRDRYRATIRDYRCRFHKKERLAGGITAEQEMVVLFRESPFSVDMRWIRNAGRANRVNYVAGRWVDDGKELALIHPSGIWGLLVPGGVKRDIHGPEAKAAARRAIDQFGFKNTFDLVIKYCERAAGDPRYDLRYTGIGTIGGRPTYVFKRWLPYTAPDDPYPDRLLEIQVDRQLLLVTACFAYSDDEGKALLGSYITTDVELNVGLSDEDF